MNHESDVWEYLLIWDVVYVWTSNHWCEQQPESWNTFKIGFEKLFFRHFAHVLQIEILCYNECEEPKTNMKMLT